MIPPQYDWLKRQDGPRHMEAAITLLGVKETIGPKMNPIIKRWADELGAADVFKDDAVPWCGLFAAYCMKLAGRNAPSAFYRAREWGTWGGLGLAGGGPSYGDVLVFVREGGGHVGFYVGEDRSAFHVLGGNQGDAVSIARIAKQRISAIGRPKYFVKPASVKPIKLAGAGTLSANEA
jgi:uncharacterized protein (TIGR02594 family)